MPSGAKQVVLCSGKVYFDAADKRNEASRMDIALVRLEQLYPFPRKALLEELAKHPEAKVVWMQEEPRNQGAWQFVQDRLQLLGVQASYLGRPIAASPAPGSYPRHRAEMDQLLDRMLQRRS